VASNVTPHWYRNGAKLATGAQVPIISWGTLIFESSEGSDTCHTAAGVNVENTAGSARQETVALATWECKAVGGTCAAGGGEVRATPRDLPWSATVIEEGAEGSGLFRQEASGIELNIECYKGGQNAGHLLFKTGPVLTENGTWEPAMKNGTSAKTPSGLEFDVKSGHLYAETAAKAAIQGTTKGSQRFEGFEGTPVPVITLAKP
jgi:hypothetical protein